MSFLEKVQQNVLYFQGLIKASIDFTLNKGAQFKETLKESVHYSLRKIQLFVETSKNTIHQGFKAAFQLIQDIPAYTAKLLNKIVSALVYSGKRIKEYSIKFYHYILSLPAYVLNLFIAAKNLCAHGFNKGYEFIRNIPRYLSTFIKEMMNDMQELWRHTKKAALHFVKEVLGFIKKIPHYLSVFIKDAIKLIKNIPNAVFGFIKNALNALQQLWNDIRKSTVYLVKAIFNFIKNIPNYISTFVKDAFNVLKQLCRDIKKAAIDCVKQVLDFIKKIPSYLLAFVRDAINALKNATRYALIETLNFIKNIPNYIVRFMRETINGLKLACQASKKAAIYMAQMAQVFVKELAKTLVEWISQTVEQVILQLSFLMGASYAVYALSVEGLADLTQWGLMNVGISISQAPLVEIITAGLSMGLLGVVTGALTYLSCKAATFVYHRATALSAEEVQNKQSTEKDSSVQPVEQSPVLEATQMYLNQFNHINHRVLNRISVDNQSNMVQQVTQSSSLRMAV